jgi:hypothetical protein
LKTQDSVKNLPTVRTYSIFFFSLKSQEDALVSVLRPVRKINAIEHKTDSRLPMNTGARDFRYMAVHGRIAVRLKGKKIAVARSLRL